MAAARKKGSSKPPAGIPPAALEEALQKGTLKPIVTAMGGEPLMLDNVLTIARTKAVDPETADFNLDVLYGEDANAQTLAGALSAMPMMAQRRVVIVRRASSLPQQARNYLAEYAKNPVDSTLLLLLFEEESPAAWITKLAANATVINCNAPRGQALRKWARDTVTRRGVEIDDDALDLITDAPGVRLIDLDQELEKASLLASESERITLETLQQVWGIEPEVNIWSFMDRVASGKRLPALRDLERIRETFDKQSGLIMSQTIRRWRMALKERLYDLQRVPFAQRQWSGNSKRQWQMAGSDLKSLPAEVSSASLKRMLELDRQRKTSSLDDQMAFERIIHRTALDREKTGK
jgi:DNA polymerase-3 subunit delta